MTNGVGSEKSRKRLHHLLPELGSRCCVMGVVNVTPDSFSDGGECLSPSAALARAIALADQGADIIDIGGESTRPGAVQLPPAEEMRRILPVVEAVRRNIRVPISVDTRNAATAVAALAAGADMINDISALRHDAGMAETLSQHRAPVVLMHMLGTPENMQQNPDYTDVVAEVKEFLAERIAFARSAGISDIVIDPGIGFGKRLQDNLTLLRELAELSGLGCPIMVGTSRKSFLGRITGGGPKDRLPETISSCVVAAMNGASILRVHDMREARAAVAVAEAIRAGSYREA